MTPRTLVITSMLLLHIIDDFHMQGILKDLKQKSWWRKQTHDPKYAWDWLVALTWHAFQWSCLILLPIVIYRIAVDAPDDAVMLAALVLNALVHAAVDHMKANMLRINLVQDQAAHVLQMAVTFLAAMPR